MISQARMISNQNCKIKIPQWYHIIIFCGGRSRYTLTYTLYLNRWKIIMISYAWFRTKFFTNSNSLTEHYVFLINEFRNTRPYHSINLNFLCIVEYLFPISQFSFLLCIQMHACEEIWLHLSVWDWVCKRFGLIIDKAVFVLIKGMFSDTSDMNTLFGYWQ